MSEEIDISKLHGTIKEYALAADRDDKNSKGYNKLDTKYEINLFKEMVEKAGKQTDLKKQLPFFKGLKISKVNKNNETTTAEETILNKRIIDLMKEEGVTTPEQIKEIIDKKNKIKKNK